MKLSTSLLIASTAGVFALTAAACAQAQSGAPAKTPAPVASTPAAVTPPAAPTAPAASAPAAAPAAKPAAAGGVAPLTDDETKQAVGILSTRCTLCHSADTITSLTNDRDGWVAVLDGLGMAANASLNPTEESLVLRYLVQNYGPKQ